VYADGTAQKIMPTVPLPDRFIAKGQTIPGVEKIQLNADGTFTVKYKGLKLKLLPMQFDVQTKPVAAEQTVESDITVQADGTVKYVTQDEAGTEQLEVTLAITE
jgi:carbon monoxide dehydrogenase subunit G